MDPLHPYHTDPPAFGGPQTISFPALVDKAVGDATFPLLALASSGLPVVRFIESFGCRGGRKLRHGFGAGSTTITAMQMGDDRYHPASPSVGSFTSFLRALKTISSSPSNLFPKRSGMTRPFSWWPLPYPRNQPSVFTLPVTFTVDYGPASVDAAGVLVLDGMEGNVSITATQSGALRKAAPPVTLIVEVTSRQRQEIRFPAPGTGGLRLTLVDIARWCSKAYRSRVACQFKLPVRIPISFRFSGVAGSYQGRVVR